MYYDKSKTRYWWAFRKKSDRILVGSYFSLGNEPWKGKGKDKSIPVNRSGPYKGREVGEAGLDVGIG